MFCNRHRPVEEGQPDGLLRKNIKLWGSEMSDAKNMPTFQFENILRDEQELYNWLVTLATQTGISKVENVPKERDQLLRLRESVGYLLPTTYGYVQKFFKQPTDENRPPSQI